MTTNFSTIKALILDVDGILTDGTLYFDATGEAIKPFFAQDWAGIRMLQEKGIIVAIISGRTSPALIARCKDPKIEHLFLAQKDKLSTLKKLLQTVNITNSNVAYMGDDTPDLDCINYCGIGITVPNAIEQIKAAADHITHQHGGKGAVREICELILSGYPND